jgi:CRP-like cAMP-binding protein
MASGTIATGNKLLDAMTEDELDALRADLERVELQVRTMLYERGRPIDYVYFPIDAVGSLVTEMHDGRAVEVATVGNEGMVGLPVFLRAALTSATMAFVQVAGGMYRMDARTFSEVAMNGRVMDVMQRYTQALFTQIAQSAACNRLHDVERRLARWLLMMHDRVGRDEFPLTQEFVAQMLGVQRTTVNAAAAELQKRGLIEYVRGRMTIADRAGLERASCECYRVIAEEFRRLVPGAEASA